MRLREAGVDDDRLARLRAPIGLDLGGSTPQEVALSICAEIVAAANGASGRPLRELEGALHRRRAADPDSGSARPKLTGPQGVGRDAMSAP
jgi:xanthine dehydrogenase accessory factor